ncbi:tetratricopeptide repeat protein [Flavobacterium orientale]|uniref:TPR repeat n=1 Tax=Flavobacterium orientale TaxID=1756020 RepID=A0A916XV59_9FLAO|nr:tetratricopeptide repeat protein [Flavobacterium orientale]GGD14877.1 hypothetical protein GCM10011343_02370 [Flavobacterium orientale]
MKPSKILKMKKTLLIIFIVSCNCIFAQENGLKARIEFEEAEKAYAEGNYELALEKVKKAESLLGKWTPKTGHLKILTLDNLADYHNLDNSLTIQQVKEVKAYMSYATTNQSEVDLDKFKIVYKIEENLNNLSKFTNEEKIYDEMLEYVRGTNALKNKDYSIAVSEFKASAAKGNPKAMISLGILYGFNESLKDEKEASYWFKQAGDNGYPVGYHWLGRIHSFSKIATDYELAFKYFKKAYEMGLLGPYASGNYYFIGICYHSGQGVQRDLQEAVRFYKMATKAGSLEAMAELGRMTYYGYGIAVNRNEGLKLLKMAADKNLTDGLRYLGNIYFDENDFNLSFSYYEKAYSRNKNKMGKLGDAWKKGELLDIQTDFAIAWLNDNASKGDKDAMYGLFKYYEYKDRKLADEWLKKWSSAK